MNTCIKLNQADRDAQPLFFSMGSFSLRKNTVVIFLPAGGISCAAMSQICISYFASCVNFLKLKVNSLQKRNVQSHESRGCLLNRRT